MLISFSRFIQSVEDVSMSRVLQKLGCLYGLWRLQNYLGQLYEGEYCCKTFSSLLEEAILKLCVDLKDDSVALADAIAPTDFLLNSVLGKSDGQAYKNIYDELMKVQKNPDFFLKPESVPIQSKI
ncbi:peroxisomal acyl-coenzyme A oxidase 3-like [Centruroides sculpturatus]|uniref:peroxisomal acyl-coenzyme A oxidase 3-like n=1 Tax=Centruroides sculpturatus TaxID=218467 RepID=UPI000C6D54A8|nr:peroxisomal acyl-coenzyme A oxidase 3-like [Centruroides sculpturatus]XP_023243523.1 peroxisomal acyl-coenzyme A oxidase 3-like [Centruroides sculpturatus]